MGSVNNSPGISLLLDQFLIFVVFTKIICFFQEVHQGVQDAPGRGPQRVDLFLLRQRDLDHRGSQDPHRARGSHRLRVNGGQIQGTKSNNEFFFVRAFDCTMKQPNLEANLEYNLYWVIVMQFFTILKDCRILFALMRLTCQCRLTRLIGRRRVNPILDFFPREGKENGIRLARLLPEMRTHYARQASTLG